MKKEIWVKKEVDIRYADCVIIPRFFEDAMVNGVQEIEDEPQMSCLKMVEDRTGKHVLAWCPVIDLDNGRILNWPIGESAYVGYKSIDNNKIILVDADNNEVKVYEGYVPDFLSPFDEGNGDYVNMIIDENGYIEDFDGNIDDIFEK